MQESKELKEFKDGVETLTEQNKQCDLDPLKLSHASVESNLLLEKADLNVCVIDGSKAFQRSADRSHLSFFLCLLFFPCAF